jgi:hypothetical protein
VPLSPAPGPGCVKTCTNRECAELFSLFSSYDGDRQSGSFLIERNRDKLSTRRFDVGVFTQAGSKAEILAMSNAFPLFPRKRTSFERLRVHALGVSVSGVGALTRYYGANATSRTAQCPHMAARRDQHSPSHCRAYLLRCAQESSWGEDDSNKKPPKVSLRRLFGPLGDPLVCTPF